MGLTAKQDRFVAEYLKDLNATQAAGRAGYSDPNIGRQLITKHNVAKAIAAAQAKRAERVEVDQDYVLTTIVDTIERCRQAKAVTDHDGEETGEWKFEANAVLKGAELLGRHLAMFTDKAVFDHNYVARMPDVAASADEWQNQHAPKPH